MTVVTLYFTIYLNLNMVVSNTILKENNKVEVLIITQLQKLLKGYSKQDSVGLAKKTDKWNRMKSPKIRHP